MTEIIVTIQYIIIAIGGLAIVILFFISKNGILKRWLIVFFGSIVIACILAISGIQRIYYLIPVDIAVIGLVIHLHKLYGKQILNKILNKLKGYK